MHAFDIFYFHVVIFDPSGTYAGLKHKACFSRVYSCSPHQNSLDNPFFSPAVSFHTPALVLALSSPPQTSSVRPNLKTNRLQLPIVVGLQHRRRRLPGTVREGVEREWAGAVPRLALFQTEGSQSAVSIACPLSSLPLSAGEGLPGADVSLSKPRRKGTQEAEGATHKGQRK